MLWNYLRDKRKTAVVIAVCAVIFAAVFFLYSLPLKAVLYGALISLVFIILVFIYDFSRYCRRDKELKRLYGSIVCGINELPDGKGLIEADYAALLHEFNDEYRALISRTDKSQREMMDFYTLWVHQIKTPIAAMSVMLQENPSEENARLAQELFKIERYVELVLGYLRIDEISSDLSLSRCKLDGIVKQAVKKYAPMFIHKKIKLEIDGLDVDVLTDEKWLVFVVEQLISNALKYTKKGTITITADEHKILSVSDTGIGINAEDLPRVFEKGFTGFNGRMDKKSTGLGLYLCRKTLDKLHHNIAIVSEQGKGTTVKIDLHSEETFIE